MNKWKGGRREEGGLTRGIWEVEMYVEREEVKEEV